jgi:hypothetical protein
MFTELTASSWTEISHPAHPSHPPHPPHPMRTQGRHLRWTMRAPPLFASSCAHCSVAALHAATGTSGAAAAPSLRVAVVHRFAVTSPLAACTSRAFEKERIPERAGRKISSHFILIAGTMVLLPGFLLFAAFMLWVVHLQPNALNILVMCVSVVMPAVMYTGWRGAAKRSEPVLRGYSFALSVVITMQLSMVIVALLDDGTLAEAYGDSSAAGFLSLCSNLENPPVGVDWLNMDEICNCSSFGSGDAAETLDNATSNGAETR